MIKCSLLKLISHKYSAWCIRLCFYKVFNSSLFDKNNKKKTRPTVCHVKNVKSKRGPDDVLAADYPTYCTSILRAALQSFDWTGDPRLTPVGMLRVWPVLTSRLPHAGPRPGSCNYVEGESFFANTYVDRHTPWHTHIQTQELL